jgi:hypothetical protein
VLETLVPVTVVGTKDAGQAGLLAAPCLEMDATAVAAVIRVSSGIVIELNRATPAQIAAVAHALGRRPS